MTMQHLEPAPLTLVPASAFSHAELVSAYNQARVDYIVPMPMNVARFLEYMRWYDIDLEASCVALDEDNTMLGVAMLGIRERSAWVTRLGVLPDRRKGGVGRRLMDGLAAAAAERGISFIALEVIKHNDPGYNLFVRCGFRPVGELLVLRRPPIAPAPTLTGSAEWLGRSMALDRLESRVEIPPWTNHTQTLRNAQTVEGLAVTTSAGGRGWAVFQRLPLVLSHLVLHTEQGDPAAVGAALLAQIHHRYPDLDTHAENIALSDPHLEAFRQTHYVESFRRIEMYHGQACD